MASDRQPSAYKVYILCSWLEGSTWRYSVEEVGSGRRHGFATLDEFFSFMLAKSVLPVEGQTRRSRSQMRHESGDHFILDDER